MSIPPAGFKPAIPAIYRPLHLQWLGRKSLDYERKKGFLSSNSARRCASSSQFIAKPLPTQNTEVRSTRPVAVPTRSFITNRTVVTLVGKHRTFHKSKNKCKSACPYLMPEYSAARLTNNVCNLSEFLWLWTGHPLSRPVFLKQGSTEHR